MTSHSPCITPRKTVLHPTLEPAKARTPLLNIAVVMGGMSAEREVSLSSGKGVVEALLALGYRVTPIDMGNDIGEVLIRTAPHLVFNALHGTYGEDGCLPGMLEIMGIPYTHSGVLASSLGLDKPAAKALFMNYGIRCPRGKIIYRHEHHLHDPLPRPYVLKPLHEGSSIGVEVVFQEDPFSMKDYSWAYGDAMIAEHYVPGKEIQVAVLAGKAIGAIEIRPKGRFYDYEAKYTPGKAEHIMPAPLTEAAYQEVAQLSEKAFHILGCKSVARVDFRYADTLEGDGQFYLLEVNTHPGMTPLSLVPEIAAYAGISFEMLIEKLVQDALCEN